jgi:flavin reductase (DIM6/NTAB) family NADH-FMN oxidoreductase RutF
MTASAVSAVSLNPPLLLVCVSKDARFHDALTGNAGFALNILAEDQSTVSELFASGLDNPFLQIGYTEGPGGLSLLDDVVAHIICGSWSTYDAGDHTVFFGEVREGQIYGRAPLIHYRSNYTSIL